MFSIFGFTYGYWSILLVICAFISIYFCHTLIVNTYGDYFLSIGPIFLIFYFVFCFIGNLYFAIFITPYGINREFYIFNETSALLFLLACLGLILIPLGIKTSTIILIKDFKKKFIGFYECKIHISSNYERTRIVLLYLFLLLSVLVFVFYLFSLNEIPLFKIFKNYDAFRLYYLRTNTQINSFLKPYQFNLVLKVLTLFILSYSFYSYISKKNIHHLSIFLVSFFVIFSYSIIRLHKGPVVNLLIYLLILFLFRKHIKLLGKKQLKIYCLFIIIIFTILLVQSYLYKPGTDTKVVNKISGISKRIFFGQVAPQYYYYKFIKEIGLLHGLGMPNPGSIFNFDHIPYTKMISNYAKPELKVIGIDGSMPTVFYGQILINYGIYAAILSMYIFGVIIGIVEAILVFFGSKKKTIFVTILYVYYIYYFQRYSGTGAALLLFSPNFILPISCIIIYYSTEKVLKLKKIKSIYAN